MYVVDSADQEYIKLSNVINIQVISTSTFVLILQHVIFHFLFLFRCSQHSKLFDIFQNVCSRILCHIIDTFSTCSSFYSIWWLWSPRLLLYCPALSVSQRHYILEFDHVRRHRGQCQRCEGRYW